MTTGPLHDDALGRKLDAGQDSGCGHAQCVRLRHRGGAFANRAGAIGGTRRRCLRGLGARDHFAQTVIDHDAVAFAAHLQPGAVFVGGDGTGTHGREAIAAEWAGLIEGKALVLRWYPDAVDVSGDGKTALSRGPYWMENPAAPADKRYRVGRFISTWRRNDDGEWQVVFDGGGGNVPQPATQAEVDALAAARGACPYR